jgi:predicted TIM-barrel fold metal-dependent hydrolase
VIDSHFHIWRRADAKQSGILAAPYLQRDASWDDFRAAWGDQAVERAVNIQVNDFCDGTREARYVDEVAQRDPLLGAMIAWARIESAEARPGRERETGFRPRPSRRSEPRRRLPRSGRRRSGTGSPPNHSRVP